MESRILVVSPVRNEGAHIERVVRSVAAQELRPDRWLVIDDGSTDGTTALLESLASELPFMEVHRAGAGTPHAGARDRLARAAAPRTFNAGLACIDWRNYTHIMKLDGDIELGPSYLRVLLERFAGDPRLGLAGGVLIEPMADGGVRPIAIPRHHVHGALKCYTRECLIAIGGVQERLAWDTIDETYARMHGFSTVTFDDLVSVHHRPWGSADGSLRGRARLGECAYISQYPPVWILFRSLKLSVARPRGIVGLAYLLGYLRAAVRRRGRVRDPAYRRFTRRELRRRLREMIVRGRDPSIVSASPGVGIDPVWPAR
jgi:glycosyltransferase involved in cell wall biosynthesis